MPYIAFYRTGAFDLLRTPMKSSKSNTEIRVTTKFPLRHPPYDFLAMLRSSQNFLYSHVAFNIADDLMSCQNNAGNSCT